MPSKIHNPCHRNNGNNSNNDSKTKELTLADHAESWAKEQGFEVPDRSTVAWQDLYARWHEFSFSEFQGTTEQ